MIDALKLLSLSIANYKCFKASPVVIERIAPINVIIGRNSSGKTAILDIIQHLCGGSDNLPQHAPPGTHPHIQAILPVTPALVENLTPEHFPSVRRGLGMIQVLSNKQKPYVQLTIDLMSQNHQPPQFVGVTDDGTSKHLAKDLSEQIERPFSKYICARLGAERNITPETPGDLGDGSNPPIGPNGQGATNLCYQFMTAHDLDESIIERELLGALNTICAPDIMFSRIHIQRIKGPHWEIQLGDNSNHRISLAQMGSGIKTVLLMLLNLLVLPKCRQPKTAKIDRWVFCFEELENNLHPAMQRRLFRYIADFASTHRCTFFLTTHSHIVIDIFGANEDAQLIHVQNSGGGSQLTTVSSIDHSQTLLDDLGVRASDLLQANGVIWVEGPSDRIYLNKWIELWSEGSLTDNLDYQCLPYGGSLCAHASFAALGQSAEDAKRYRAFRINRNAIFIADRDNLKKGRVLKPHTSRIEKEINSIGGYSWVTKGREVENYIPPRCLREIGVTRQPPSNQIQMIDWIKKKTRKTWDKVALAEKITSMLTKSDLENHLDLAKHLNEICRRIKLWRDSRSF